MRTRLRGALAELLVEIGTRAVIPRDVSELAAECGLGIRTFQKRCKDAGTSAKACLDFLRCLRVVAGNSGPWNPRAALFAYCRDTRTVERLIALGGLDRPARPSVVYFIAHQKFVVDTGLRDQFKQALAAPRSGRLRTDAPGAVVLT